MPKVAIIGSAGVPNRYGGFESFVEHCGPKIAEACDDLYVTCDAGLYDDRTESFAGMRRVFIGIPANGAWSVLHDLIAYLRVFRHADCIIVLGVSGGIFFPVFRLLAAIRGAKIVVNVDGVEWRRAKYSVYKQFYLRMSDGLAQMCSHRIIYDNRELKRYLVQHCLNKAQLIEYSGDHVRLPSGRRQMSGDVDYALTICRIEPENNLELLIDGFLGSSLPLYVIVGNWSHSSWAKELKRRYSKISRLMLLDPIYDAQGLADLRAGCDVYLHGHSVGGTNPSLVEVLFYDCKIACFDCAFNRNVAGDAATYFGNASELTQVIERPTVKGDGGRDLLRRRYSASAIAEKYLEVILDGYSNSR